MDISILKQIKDPWLRLLVQMLALALIITLVLIPIFYMTGNNFKLNFRDISITFLFSFWIPISIGVLYHVTHDLFRRYVPHHWMSLFVYYIIMVAGMFIGTEITYIILDFFYDIPFNFSTQTGQLRFNLFISFVISTLFYMSDFRREYYELKLREKQIQLMRLEDLRSKAELQSLQSRINPHFLYNALNGIASLIHEDPDKAEAMLVKLSKLFRYTINSGSETMTSLENELSMLKLYVELEEMRFSDRFNFELDVSDELLSAKVPKYILQPLIENSFKHGISKITGKGIMRMSIKQADKNIVILISDNGPAFPEPVNFGYGLQATYNGLFLLYPDDFSLEMKNTPDKVLKLSFPLG